MDISDLKKELLEGKIRPLYVFTGNELALQDIYINKIKEVSGLDSIRTDYLRNIAKKLSAKTIIKVKPSIYIIRNDEDYLKSDSAWSTIMSKNFRGNIVILLYSNVEKTSKFAKAHEQFLTQFDFIGTNLLVNRLVATTKMPKQYCEDLVKICGNNYGRIKNELYKLTILARVNKYSLNTAYLQAKKQNMIHEEIGDIIFDFTNSIVDRKIKLAYELYPKVMQTEDGVGLKLITVLYNSFRNLLMVQSTSYNDRTEQVLGLSKAQIYVTSQKCNIYNTFELVNIIKILRYLEKGIKIGEVEDKYAIEYLMGQIW